MRTRALVFAVLVGLAAGLATALWAGEGGARGKGATVELPASASARQEAPAGRGEKAQSAQEQELSPEAAVLRMLERIQADQERILAELEAVSARLDRIEHELQVVKVRATRN